ncbi:flavin reductase family protein [Allohahella sp. A8]|uniref:flavin reductase family protein n=1 Tax=Allohahella sp. A8 TaxID=3141461 RepID=UPI000C0945CE|nr:protein/domain typically associated with flavoprotein oxygenase, DIM6/NTAB family protein [Hahellaceae bacterium]|tara:strand:- start:44408 stop:45031 length:624 start_codon:yes stop_codon:yes gene_type:complete
MIVDFSDLSSARVYQWMTQSVIPRPIAWVLSSNAEGAADPYNLAPFSYFTAVSSAPPTVIFSAGRKSEDAFKDSYVNVSERRHCVINIASAGQMAAVTETSRTLPYGESELSRAGLELTDFEGFHLPRVAGSPIAFACEYLQTIEVGPSPQMLVLCEVKQLYVDNAVMTVDDKGRPLIDALKADPLCRLGGGQYASLGEVFTLPRPS